MRPEFSEFSFGYALTESCMRHVREFRPDAPPPNFPTTHEEREVGYDVKMPWADPRGAGDRVTGGCFLFLQFKLCQWITRKRAKECKAKKLCPEFLRMPLMRQNRSLQHERLLAWDNGHREVYYAAPRYYKLVEFENVYRRGRMLAESAFIRPRDIGPIDCRPHCVSFKPQACYGWLFSDPKEVIVSFGIKVIRTIVGNMAVGEARTESVDDVVRELQQFLRELGVPHGDVADDDPFVLLSSLSVAHLGALPLFIHRTER